MLCQANSFTILIRVGFFLINWENFGKLILFFMKQSWLLLILVCVHLAVVKSKTLPPSTVSSNNGNSYLKRKYAPGGLCFNFFPVKCQEVNAKSGNIHLCNSRGLVQFGMYGFLCSDFMIIWWLFLLLTVAIISYAESKRYWPFPLVRFRCGQTTWGTWQTLWTLMLPSN